MLAFSARMIFGLSSRGVSNRCCGAVKTCDRNADHTGARKKELTSYRGVTCDVQRNFEWKRSIFTWVRRVSDWARYIDVNGLLQPNLLDGAGFAEYVHVGANTQGSCRTGSRGVKQR